MSGRGRSLRRSSLSTWRPTIGGDYPTLEGLILRYPGPENGELRARIAEFVLDYIELTNAARRVELTEEDLAEARVVQERAIRRCLGQVENQAPRGD